MARMLCADDHPWDWTSDLHDGLLAREIEGTRLLVLPGVDHDPWVGDSEEVLDVLSAVA